MDPLEKKRVMLHAVKKATPPVYTNAPVDSLPLPQDMPSDWNEVVPPISRAIRAAHSVSETDPALDPALRVADQSLYKRNIKRLYSEYPEYGEGVEGNDWNKVLLDYLNERASLFDQAWPRQQELLPAPAPTGRTSGFFPDEVSKLPAYPGDEELGPEQRMLRDIKLGRIPDPWKNNR